MIKVCEQEMSGHGSNYVRQYIEECTMCQDLVLIFLYKQWLCCLWIDSL